MRVLRSFQAKRADGDARSYIVTVDRAWGLAKADRFGKADPMVSIKVYLYYNTSIIHIDTYKYMVLMRAVRCA